MTTREAFAMAAMQGFLSNTEATASAICQATNANPQSAIVAKWSRYQADALVAELEKANE